MSGYSNAVKEYIERYKAEVGSDGLLDPHAVAEWAYRKGLHKPNLTTVIDAIASDIAQVFREEYRVDRHTHFQKSFAQRRHQIVDDCVQLKTDVDVYNDKRNPAEPIQIPLDFTLDVAELQQIPRKVA